MIGRLEFVFGEGYGSNPDAGAVLGALVLPDDDAYPFSIAGNCFQGCPNLTSVTPFLPRSCDKLGRDAFSFLTALRETDLYFYGSDFGSAEGCWGIVQNDTSITNVDLSASTITALRRDCFKGCTGLKTVTLPPTIQEFGAPHNSDLGMYNGTPFGDCSNVKLIFNGSTLPTILQEGRYAGGESAVSAIEFSPALTTLSDGAFVPYKNLAEIKFQGVPPTEIGENIFSGFTEKTITAHVPAEYISQWREIADDKVLTKESGGTWTSGTTQLINVYGEVKVKKGFMLIVR